jgi:hypothetical protein
MLNLENQTDFSDESETPMSIEKYYEKLTHEVEDRAGLLNKWVALFEDSIVTDYVHPDFKKIQVLEIAERGYACDGFALTYDGEKLCLMFAWFKNDAKKWNLTKAWIEIISKQVDKFWGEMCAYVAGQKSSLASLFNKNDLFLRSDYEALNILKKHTKTIQSVDIYIISNGFLSSQASSTAFTQTTDGLELRLNVYTIENFFAKEERGEDKTREIKFNGPCLKGMETPEMTSYLTVISGSDLANLYKIHGVQLLESNVRAYLGKRGSKNKGIQKTLLEEKEHFFAYNNGITATAKDIRLNKNESQITHIQDLQIVNGGQTTFLIFDFQKENPTVDLSELRVLMKLNVLKKTHNSEKQIDLIANIAKYSNTQNEIKAPDLGSNHDYFQIMAKLSSKNQAPSKAGAIQGSYWYYERLRGSYKQSIAMKHKKEKNWPKEQVFDKEVLSKLHIIFNTDMTHLIFTSQSHNYFIEKWLKADLWANRKQTINDAHFQTIIAQLIIYQTVETNITQQLNIKSSEKTNLLTAYVIALIIALLKEEKLSLNYLKIWQNQSVSATFLENINTVQERLIESFSHKDSVIDAKKPDFLYRLLSKYQSFNLLTIELKNECLKIQEAPAPEIHYKEKAWAKFYTELEKWLKSGGNQADWESLSRLLNRNEHYEKITDDDKKIFLIPYHRVTGDKKTPKPNDKKIQIIIDLLNGFVVNDTDISPELKEILDETNAALI